MARQSPRRKEAGSSYSAATYVIGGGAGSGGARDVTSSDDVPSWASTSSRRSSSLRRPANATRKFCVSLRREIGIWTASLANLNSSRKPQRAMGETMPFSRYKTADSDLMEAMREAFYRVCDILQLSFDREDPLTEIVAAPHQRSGRLAGKL
jgi:hypothetical protein